VLLASRFQTVLDAILYAYAFMVSGLFIPTLGAYFWRGSSPTAALLAMLSGGTFSLIALTRNYEMWGGLDASFYGIAISAVVFVVFSLLIPGRRVSQQQSMIQ